MVVKVRDLLGTRFIINSIAGAFRTAILNAKEDGTTLDLAGCRLGPDCEIILRSYQHEVVFINSEEPELDAILKHNRAIHNTVYPDYPAIEFPVIEDGFDIPSYIMSIPTGKYLVKLYGVSTNNWIVTRLLICLILLCRPDIELDLSECAYLIFERLNKDLNIESFIRKGYTKFYKVYAPIVCEVDSNDGSFTYTDKVIPAEIGEKVIFDIVNKRVISEDYMSLIKSILRELSVNINRNDEEVYIRLIDLLRYKEDSDDEF